MSKIKKKTTTAKKTAVNNQWISSGLKPDRRERRDGPGGEDSQ